MLRRASTLLAIAAVLALVAAPAAANHTYMGSAEATSFELSVAGEGLVVGDTTAGVQSSTDIEGALCDQDIAACATGAGEALLGDTASASAPGDPGPNSVVAFSTDQLPAGLPVSATIGAAEAEASDAPNPSARGDAQAAKVTIGAGGLEGDPLGQITGAIEDLLGGGAPDVGGTGDDGGDGGDDGDTGTPLDAIIGQLPGGQDNPLGSVLEDLTGGLGDLSLQTQQQETALLDVELGTSHAESSDNDHNDGATAATAVAEGGTVTVLSGLVTVQVGDSTATVESTRTDASADASSAPLTVTIGAGQLPPQLQDALGQLELPGLGGNGDGLTIQVPEGESICLGDELSSLAGTELPADLGPVLSLFDIFISAAGTSTDVNGAAAAARADAIAIELFNGNCGPDDNPLPAIVLNAATAEASATSAEGAVTEVKAQQQQQDQQPDLPRTGGGAALAALALLGGGTLLARRRN